jgi:trimeric autotransporter adhesin
MNDAPRGSESGGGHFPLGSSPFPDAAIPTLNLAGKERKNHMNPLIQRTTILPRFISLALACFAVSQGAQGVVPPPPGGYPNFTTAAGDNALQALTSGLGNTAIGTFSLFSVTTGSFNTAVGAGALDLNTADSNTATGAAALLFNTTGTENTANGTAALEFNVTGSQNTANGAFALFSNTAGAGNTANGAGALQSNTIGNQNMANGQAALFSNTVGAGNTANGAGALQSNTTGNQNMANGQAALFSNTTGNVNTANGLNALFSNTTGNGNTANGEGALSNNTTGDDNTVSGMQALDNNTTGFSNSVLGAGAGNGVTTADHVICIGANVSGANVSNTTWIANVYGNATLNTQTAPVIVSVDGQLGTVVSSERFKKDIATMDSASEGILSLRPVTFHYKTDGTSTPQFGLIAEEVAKVNPALVIADKEGKPFTVRYDAVNAMLLNEFLKEHRKNEEQEVTIASLQKQVAALTAGLQKVSAQVEASKPAPQVVNNP